MDNKEFLRKLVGENEREMNLVDILKLYDAMNMKTEKKREVLKKIEKKKTEPKIELYDDFKNIELNIENDENIYYLEICSNEVYKVNKDQTGDIEGECYGEIYISNNEYDYLTIIDGIKYLILTKYEFEIERIDDLLYDQFRMRVYRKIDDIVTFVGVYDLNKNHLKIKFLV